MAVKIKRTINRNDTASQPVVVTLGVTDTVLAVAKEDRIFFEVTLVATGFSNEDAFVRLEAGGDDDFLGIPLYSIISGNANAHVLTWRMPPDNIYTGEIVAVSNTAAEVFTTEY